MEERIFNKICIVCGEDFQSPSRNKRLCGKVECLEKHKNKQKRLRKRRNKYRKNAEVLREDAKNRKKSREIAMRLYLSICHYCGEERDWEELDVHHKDCDPSNMHPHNLMPLCNPPRQCHNIIQSILDKRIKENLQKLEEEVEEKKELLSRAKGLPSLALKLYC